MRNPQPESAKKISGRSRVTTAIAIAFFVVLTACGEPTGPKTFCCVDKPEPEQTAVALMPLATELHDAADIFAQGVEDATLRGKAESAVNLLADQLLTGKVAPSRAALAQARTLIASLNDVDAIELDPVALALDYVERRINEVLAAQGG
jgi:hypothetical protein